MRLKTYLHVSDLHVDAEDEPLKRKFSRVAQHWLAHEAGFSGLLGHEPEALADLDYFHRVGPPWEDGETPEVITTGDLTAVGHPLAFDRAAAFLNGTGDPADAQLGAADWQDRAVAGNHDYWPGRIGWLGRFTDGLTTYFPHANRPGEPWRAYGHRVTLGGNRPDLVFLGVNTDSDNPAYGSRRRVLGRGSFRRALDALDKMMGREPTERQIRVLLLHHATRHRGITLQIDDTTLDRLRDFALKLEVSVLLCGHLHSHELDRPRLNAFNPKHAVLEVRCGTSAQIPEILPEWRRHFGLGPVQTARNSVIVHRLLEESGEIRWEATAYERDKQNRGFPVPRASKTVKVWPRP